MLKPLQHKMQQALLKEKVLMEQRIKDFEHQQRQAFVKLFNKTQQDRASIFANIKQHMLQHEKQTTSGPIEYRKSPSFTDLQLAVDTLPSALMRTRSRSMEHPSPRLMPANEQEKPAKIRSPLPKIIIESREDQFSNDLSQSMPSMVYITILTK
jgi:hypothetical protein